MTARGAIALEQVCRIGRLDSLGASLAQSCTFISVSDGPPSCDLIYSMDLLKSPLSVLSVETGQRMIFCSVGGKMHATASALECLFSR